MCSFPKQSASIDQWSAQAGELLPESESPKLDMEVLLGHVLSKSRAFLYTWPETQLTETQYAQLVALVKERQLGKPIAHLLGMREFWSLPLLVTPDTLIPRPDTEVLIEWVLEHFSNHDACKVVDLGTGTGAIALALASESPEWQLSGCDRIPEAVELARRNAEQLGLARVDFFESSWFERFGDSSKASFHLIVSNPPYIAEDDPHLVQGDVRFEPKSALTAGKDGLDDIRIIAQDAMSYLISGGCLLVEHGYDQADAVQQIFKHVGLNGVGSGKDYNGNDRFTYGFNQEVTE